MFGLDAWLAGFSDGTTLLLVIGVGVVLGLRHATDPDHLAAVTTLMASKREQAAGAAARLGLVWGLGHATSLFVFGLPIVLFEAYLPAGVQQGAEASVGLLIAGLAVWLLVRWRRGLLHLHDHTHLYSHAHERCHGHAHRPRTRTPLGAYAIGLVHGMGGSAGVGVLLLATIQSRAVAAAALALFAACTALSMALLSTGFGLTLGRPRVQSAFGAFAPAFGVASLAFGAWYFLGALELVPYYL
jgi:high-affinity nickel permease